MWIERMEKGRREEKFFSTKIWRKQNSELPLHSQIERGVIESAGRDQQDTERESGKSLKAEKMV